MQSEGAKLSHELLSWHDIVAGYLPLNHPAPEVMRRAAKMLAAIPAAPNETLSAQDERRALADRIASDQYLARGRFGGVLWLSNEDAAIVIAALRADPARGAEEMRERAAKVCEDIAGGNLGKISVTAASSALRCAQVIRALPAQGGEDG